MNVTCILDETVHRTLGFNSPLHVPSATIKFTLRKLGAPTAQFPEGHYLEIDKGTGTLEQMACAGIKMPQTRDCIITAKSNGQDEMVLDDRFWRVLVIGAELATPGSKYSLSIFRQANPVDASQKQDFFVYSDSAVTNQIIPLDSSSIKIPPGVGLSFKDKAGKDEVKPPRHRAGGADEGGGGAPKEALTT